MSPKNAVKKDTAVNQQEQLPEETDKFDLVRPAGQGDTLHKLYHELGLFSNIIVFGSYNHQLNKNPLSKEAFFAALGIVIEQHPNLSVILVSQPSTKQTGKHRVWKAKLKRIDLNKCVSFINEYDDSDSGMQELLQKAHNDWFDTEDRTLPLWKVIVVNDVHVVFIFHHSICDGIGGTLFHKSLLAALNEVSKSGNHSNPSIITTPDAAPPADPVAIFQEQKRKASMIRIVLVCIWLLILRLILRKKDWFFEEATYSMKVPPLEQRGRADIRAKTVLRSLRLDKSVLVKCLEACKKNNTTFTAMLSTLIDVTLATDIYPSSKYRILATQVDCRRYSKQKDNLRNLASTMTHNSFVGDFRKVGTAPILRISGSESSPLIGNRVIMNYPQFWNLARKCNDWLKDRLSETKQSTPIPLQDFMVMATAREDEEAFAAQILPSIGLMSERAYTVSNLGAFDGDFGGEDGEEAGPCRIKNLEFSVGSTKSCVGYMLYFGVVSLKGGDCMIHVTYNKGVLDDEKVWLLLDRIEQRLGFLLENS